MTTEHAAHARSLRGNSPQFKQTLLTQSRETGDVLPPKQADGTAVTATSAPVTKSWAHFVAGG